MKKYNWSKLSHLQIGRYAEYLAKMEFMLFGFDVYTAEVDEHGIDFIIKRNHNQYYDIQVKSSRRLNYIFFLKDRFIPKPNLLAMVILFLDDEPAQPYLIPSQSWLYPNSLLVGRDYGETKKSKPEWGLNLSLKNLPLLAEFSFEQTILKL